jgi:hypothetical protein
VKYEEKLSRFTSLGDVDIISTDFSRVPICAV